MHLESWEGLRFPFLSFVGKSRTVASQTRVQVPEFVRWTVFAAPASSKGNTFFWRSAARLGGGFGAMGGIYECTTNRPGSHGPRFCHPCCACTRGERPVDEFKYPSSCTHHHGTGIMVYLLTGAHVPVAAASHLLQCSFWPWPVSVPATGRIPPLAQFTFL